MIIKCIIFDLKIFTIHLQSFQTCTIVFETGQTLCKQAMMLRLGPSKFSQSARQCMRHFIKSDVLPRNHGGLRRISLFTPCVTTAHSVAYVFANDVVSVSQ